MSQKQSTSVAKVPSTAELVEVIQKNSPTALAGLNQAEAAMQLADAIGTVKSYVAANAERVMALQGSSLGFRTDKDSTGGYPVQTVVECATEAMLRGLNLAGNEFNIIAGRCYVAQQGMVHLVRDYPGLTDLVHYPEVPVMRDGGAIVKYRVTWKLNGVPMEIVRMIPIRVNNGQGADAILGKAMRKILAAIYQQLTGSTISEGDVTDLETAVVPSKVQAIEDKIADKATESTKNQKPKQQHIPGVDDPEFDAIKQ